MRQTRSAASAASDETPGFFVSNTGNIMYRDADGTERLPVTQDYVNLQDAKATAEQARDEAREAAVSA
jgi:hypothetical protein